MQTYTNENNAAIEAKYVFPLDDQAAVCGFEAFINGKHVVGEVKEKEEAHREYREAISKGHGAYLMDQDKETPVWLLARKRNCYFTLSTAFVWKFLLFLS